MKTYDITLVTAEAYVQPSNPNWYVQQILEEDGLVQQALEAEGWRVHRAAWSGDFDWSQTHCALFRTPWDYSRNFEAFRQWLAKTRTQTHFINPVAMVSWNSDKHYLRELAQAGVPVPTTHFIPKGSTTTLAALHQTLGWNHTVLKPTIAAGGRHTYQLKPEDWADKEALFQTLIAEEDLMLQPFLKFIVEKGELALMVVEKTVTHAVRKIAKPGDFRVQDNFGGTVAAHQPSEAAIALAQQAVAACPGAPLYARVDLVWENDNQLAVSELEIFEPEMWFRFQPSAAQTLAAALGPYLKQLI